MIFCIYFSVNLSFDYLSRPSRLQTSAARPASELWLAVSECDPIVVNLTFNPSSPTVSFFSSSSSWYFYIIIFAAFVDNIDQSIGIHGAVLILYYLLAQSLRIKKKKISAAAPMTLGACLMARRGKAAENRPSIECIFDIWKKHIKFFRINSNYT